MPKGRGRTIGTGARGFAAGLLALCLLGAGPAAADPQPSDTTRSSGAPVPGSPDPSMAARARALQAELDARYAAVERLTERLDGADERRAALASDLAGLRARQAAVAAELAAAQRRLDEQARATYMAGPEWFVSELVGAVDPADALRRLPLQKAVLEAAAATVTQVRDRKAELDGLNGRVAADLAEQQRVHDQLAAQRAELQGLADRLQATLRGLDRRLAGFLAAEDARTEAARRAAWAAYMAGRSASGLRPGPAARAAVRWALAQLGDPYRWGAAGPDAFDCSGLTSAAYRAAGVAIPRTSLGQWAAGPHVDVTALVPGDLLFYADDPAAPGTIHHVGMYLGGGLMVHAPHTGDVVRIASVWREGYAGAVRAVPAVAAPGAPPPPAPPTTAPPTPPSMTTAPPTTARPTTTVPPTTAPPRPSTSTSTAATTTTTTTSTTAPPTT
jgi:peptidoglycan DL-endopeptidase CwlO